MRVFLDQGWAVASALAGGFLATGPPGRLVLITCCFDSSHPAGWEAFLHLAHLSALSEALHKVSALWPFC